MAGTELNPSLFSDLSAIEERLDRLERISFVTTANPILGRTISTGTADISVASGVNGSIFNLTVTHNLGVTPTQIVATPLSFGGGGAWIKTQVGDIGSTTFLLSVKCETTRGPSDTHPVYWIAIN